MSTNSSFVIYILNLHYENQPWAGKKAQHVDNPLHIVTKRMEKGHSESTCGWDT